nr:hypothetical protein [uncultured Shinella sp.]
MTIEVSDGLNKVTKVFTITISDILETITGTAKGEVLKGGIGMDRIVGLAGNDTLYGYGGNDLLEGGAGDDVLSGGAGNDRLVGGAGFDDLYGGAGSDRFIFRSVKELGTSKTATDTIIDFSQKEKDLIDFTMIDASLKKAGDQAFTFIGTAKFSNTAGELRYEKAKAGTYVYGDTDGNGKADFVMHIDAVFNLKAGDFLL